MERAAKFGDSPPSDLGVTRRREMPKKEDLNDHSKTEWPTRLLGNQKETSIYETPFWEVDTSDPRHFGLTKPVPKCPDTYNL